MKTLLLALILTACTVDSDPADPGRFVCRRDFCPHPDASPPDAMQDAQPDAAVGSLAVLPDGTYVCVPIAGARPCLL